MAYPLCSAPLSFFKPKPVSYNCFGDHIHTHQTLVQKCNVLNVRGARFRCVKAKAANKSNQSKKPNSVICGDCDGNGAVQCSQCLGIGVNSVDFFNGEFKAVCCFGFCRGKKHMLCGNCNGAGFIGGFMSTFDE
ncbi:protein BUNDLE SHEATH DEFECTIVE 2, chloroplastic-like isoform X2 [Humulus lupulus]|uniref:protein BUNDLE SHEATH DEFECTIVE 2, chloroplastic-like isoform X2 n=1 Tax=Humulus lupulus TaxID=3486 RepID=UPI002B403314|nr:protein BUNDLE SHEATH DEFECTIVE 2, chloroplastic-like isoform X2 [Humulus lupulus]